MVPVRPTVRRSARSKEAVDLIGPSNVGQVCNLPVFDRFNRPIFERGAGLQPAGLCQIHSPNSRTWGRFATGVTIVPRGEAMTIADPESPHPHRRLNRLRHEVPIQELPVV